MSSYFNLLALTQGSQHDVFKKPLGRYARWDSTVQSKMASKQVPYGPDPLQEARKHMVKRPYTLNISLKIQRLIIKLAFCAVFDL